MAAIKELQIKIEVTGGAASALKNISTHLASLGSVSIQPIDLSALTSFAEAVSILRESFKSLKSDIAGVKKEAQDTLKALAEISTEKPKKASAQSAQAAAPVSVSGLDTVAKKLEDIHGLMIAIAQTGASAHSPAPVTSLTAQLSAEAVNALTTVSNTIAELTIKVDKNMQDQSAHMVSMSTVYQAEAKKIVDAIGAIGSAQQQLKTKTGNAQAQVNGLPGTPSAATPAVNASALSMKGLTKDEQADVLVMKLKALNEIINIDDVAMQRMIKTIGSLSEKGRTVDSLADFFRKPINSLDDLEKMAGKAHRALAWIREAGPARTSSMGITDDMINSLKVVEQYSIKVMKERRMEREKDKQDEIDSARQRSALIKQIADAQALSPAQASAMYPKDQFSNEALKEQLATSKLLNTEREKAIRDDMAHNKVLEQRKLALGAGASQQDINRAGGDLSALKAITRQYETLSARKKEAEAIGIDPTKMAGKTAQELSKMITEAEKAKRETDALQNAIVLVSQAWGVSTEAVRNHELMIGKSSGEVMRYLRNLKEQQYNMPQVGKDSMTPSDYAGKSVAQVNELISQYKTLMTLMDKANSLGLPTQSKVGPSQLSAEIAKIRELISEKERAASIARKKAQEDIEAAERTRLKVEELSSQYGKMAQAVTQGIAAQKAAKGTDQDSSLQSRLKQNLESYQKLIEMMRQGSSAMKVSSDDYGKFAKGLEQIAEYYNKLVASGTNAVEAMKLVQMEISRQVSTSSSTTGTAAGGALSPRVLQDMRVAANQAGGMVQEVTNQVVKNMSVFEKFRSGIKDYISFQAEWYTGAALIFSAVGAIKTAMTAALEFQQTMQNIKAVTIGGDDVDKNIQNISDAAIRLSMATPLAATEVAKLGLQLVRAGMEANQISSGMETAAKVAVVSGEDIKTVADAVATAVMAWKVQSKDIPDIGNALAAGLNFSRLTIADIGTAFNYMAGVMSSMNKSFLETISIMAVYSNMGVKASTIATGFSQLLAEFVAPTKKARQYLEGLTDATSGLKIKIADLDPTVYHFSTILRRLESAGFDSSKALEIFQVRAGRSLMIAMRAGSDEFVKMEAKIKNSKQLADGVAEVMKGPQAAISETWNTLKASAIEVGLAISPMIIVVSKALQGLAEAFYSVASFANTAIGKLILTAGALVLLSTQLGAIKSILSFLAPAALMTGLSSVARMIGAIGPAIMGVIAAVRAGGPILAAFMAPFAGISWGAVAAMVALAAAVGVVIRNFKSGDAGAGKAYIESITKNGAQAKAVMDDLGEHAETAVGTMRQIEEQIKSAVSALEGLQFPDFKSINDADWSNTWMQNASAIAYTNDEIRRLESEFVAMKEVAGDTESAAKWQKAWSDFKNFVAGTWEDFKSGIYTAIGRPLEQVMDRAIGKWKALVDWIQGSAATLIKALTPDAYQTKAPLQSKDAAKDVQTSIDQLSKYRESLIETQYAATKANAGIQSSIDAIFNAQELTPEQKLAKFRAQRDSFLRQAGKEYTESAKKLEEMRKKFNDQVKAKTIRLEPGDDAETGFNKYVTKSVEVQVQAVSQMLAKAEHTLQKAIDKKNKKGAADWGQEFLNQLKRESQLAQEQAKTKVEVAKMEMAEHLQLTTQDSEYTKKAYANMGRALDEFYQHGIMSAENYYARKEYLAEKEYRDQLDLINKQQSATDSGFAMELDAEFSVAQKALEQQDKIREAIRTKRATAVDAYGGQHTVVLDEKHIQAAQKELEGYEKAIESVAKNVAKIEGQQDMATLKHVHSLRMLAQAEEERIRAMQLTRSISEATDPIKKEQELMAILKDQQSMIIEAANLTGDWKAADEARLKLMKIEQDIARGTLEIKMKTLEIENATLAAKISQGTYAQLPEQVQGPLNKDYVAEERDKQMFEMRKRMLDSYGQYALLQQKAFETKYADEAQKIADPMGYAIKKVNIEWSKSHEQMYNLAKTTYEGLATSFSDIFYDAITGKLKSLQDYFKSIFSNILRFFTNALGQMAAQKMMISLGIDASGVNASGFSGGNGSMLGGLKNLFGGGSSGTASGAFATIAGGESGMYDYLLANSTSQSAADLATFAASEGAFWQTGAETITSAVGDGMSGILGALGPAMDFLPYVGLAVGAISLISSLFENKDLPQMNLNIGKQAAGYQGYTTDGPWQRYGTGSVLFSQQELGMSQGQMRQVSDSFDATIKTLVKQFTELGMSMDNFSGDFVRDLGDIKDMSSEQISKQLKDWLGEYASLASGIDFNQFKRDGETLLDTVERIVGGIAAIKDKAKGILEGFQLDLMTEAEKIDFYNKKILAAYTSALEAAGTDSFAGLYDKFTEIAQAGWGVLSENSKKASLEGITKMMNTLAEYGANEQIKALNKAKQSDAAAVGDVVQSITGLYDEVLQSTAAGVSAIVGGTSVASQETITAMISSLASFGSNETLKSMAEMQEAMKAHSNATSAIGTESFMAAYQIFIDALQKGLVALASTSKDAAYAGLQEMIKQLAVFSSSAVASTLQSMTPGVGGSTTTTTHQGVDPRAQYSWNEMTQAWIADRGDLEKSSMSKSEMDAAVKAWEATAQTIQTVVNSPAFGGTSPTAPLVSNVAAPYTYSGADQAAQDAQNAAANIADAYKKVAEAMTKLRDNLLEYIKSLKDTSAIKELTADMYKVIEKADKYKGMASSEEAAAAGVEFVNAADAWYKQITDYAKSLKDEVDKLKTTLSDSMASVLNDTDEKTRSYLNSKIDAKNVEVMAAAGDPLKEAKLLGELMPMVQQRYDLEMSYVKKLRDDARSMMQEFASWWINIETKINSLSDGNFNLSGLQAIVDLGINYANQYNALGSDVTAGNFEEKKYLYGQITSMVDAYYNAGIAAIQDKYAEIQKKQDAINKEHLEILNKQLSVMQGWKDLAKQIAETIRSIKYSGQNPDDVFARMASVRADIATLGTEYQSATPERQLEIAQQLQQMAQTLLQLGGEAYQRPSQEYQDLYKEVLGWLQGLGDYADTKSTGIEGLKQEIKDIGEYSNLLQEQMNAELKDFKAQMIPYYEWLKGEGAKIYNQQWQDTQGKLDKVLDGQTFTDYMNTWSVAYYNWMSGWQSFLTDSGASTIGGVISGLESVVNALGPTGELSSDLTVLSNMFYAYAAGLEKSIAGSDLTGVTPMAEGGFFDKGTYIPNMLVGEAGPEYILPERRLKSIVEGGKGGDATVTINIPISIQGGEPQETAEAVLQVVHASLKSGALKKQVQEIVKGR